MYKLDIKYTNYQQKSHCEQAVECLKRLKQWELHENHHLMLCPKFEITKVMSEDIIPSNTAANEEISSLMVMAHSEVYQITMI